MTILHRIGKRILENWFVESAWVYLDRRIAPGYSVRSYAQEGEDMILNRIFDWKMNGFYVDVGAHHPYRFSNTYFFYLRGWRGINIDPMPGCMQAFRKFRPRDTNLEIAIHDVKRIQTYYMFQESALNGFSKTLSENRHKAQSVHLLSELEIETQTLSDVLDRYLPPQRLIDFLSVDVEGCDYEVLKSNNWRIYRPNVVLAEDLSLGALDKVGQSNIVLFMREVDYIPLCKTFNTTIFIERNSLSMIPQEINNVH